MYNKLIILGFLFSHKNIFSIKIYNCITKPKISLTSVAKRFKLKSVWIQQKNVYMKDSLIIDEVYADAIKKLSNNNLPLCFINSIDLFGRFLLKDIR